MKLLFGIKTMATRGGGAERVLTKVCSALVKRGHHVTVVSFEASDAIDFYEFDSRVVRVKIAVGCSDSRSTLLEILRRIHALRAVSRRSRADVAIGFMHSFFVPLGWAMLGSGIPMIASEHCGRGYYRTRPWQFRAIRASLGRFARMTIPSAEVRRGFPTAFQCKMVEVANPVDFSFAERDRPQPRENILLNVGRLAQEKDQRTLIEAFARLASGHPSWHLRIIGEGELRGELEAQVARLGMADRISLPGTTAAIDEEYRRAAMFVLPSLHESFGLATAEALAHGLPAIGFADCPGTNELIEHRVNGLLAEGSNRAEALAASLAELMDSPQLRRSLGAAGPASVARFSIDSVVDKWEELLRSVIARAAVRPMDKADPPKH